MLDITRAFTCATQHTTAINFICFYTIGNHVNAYGTISYIPTLLAIIAQDQETMPVT